MMITLQRAGLTLACLSSLSAVHSTFSFYLRLRLLNA